MEKYGPYMAKNATAFNGAAEELFTKLFNQQVRSYADHDSRHTQIF